MGMISELKVRLGACGQAPYFSRHDCAFHMSYTVFTAQQYFVQDNEN